MDKGEADYAEMFLARHPKEPKCERCGKAPVVGLFSDDGLPGHEFLVCHLCWDYLNAEVPDE